MEKLNPDCRLGSSGPKVSRIGLGCMSLSGIYGPSDESDAIGLVHHALDRGINFLDSSDMYGWGHNETLLARAIKGRRHEVVLSTKFGQVRTSEGGVTVDGSPDYVIRACEASLRRLEVDVIDVYYQHRVDPKVPIEDTVGAMARLVRDGKVRHLGLCEANTHTIRRASRVHPIVALQSEYSLLYRDQAEEVLVATRELGISFVAYAPLGRGLLTGTVHTPEDVANDARQHHPRFMADNLRHNRKLVDHVAVVAAQKSCTPAQLVLAWLLAQGPDVIPIPGTRNTARFDENLAALEITLTPTEIRFIEAALPRDAAKGLRYSEAGMKGVFL